MDEEKELPKPYRELAETIGMDATLRLCRRFGGENIYIPKVDKLLIAKRRELIRAEWTGENTAELARKHHLSVRAVQQILEGMRPPEVEGQIGVEELLGTPAEE